MTIIQDFVKFARATEYDDIPPEVREIAVKAFIDTIAVMYRGGEAEKPEKLARFIQRLPSLDQSTVIGKEMKTSMANAALINGMLAHVDDYDDSGLPGHVSAVLVPAALSAAECCGSTGQEMLKAYCIGVELQYKLAEVMSPMINQAGWHATCIYGALGATAIAGVLLGLNEEDFVNALGLVTSKASGIVVNFGTSTKSYQNGLAAANGIEAALLARAGIDASLSAFEGVGGLAQCFSSATFPQGGIRFGVDWGVKTHGLCLKKYPCCLGSHGAIEALTGMMQEHGFTGDDVESVTGEVMGYAYRCLSYEDPTNELEAKFSLPYALASVLVDRKVTLRSFHQSRINDPVVRNEMVKVRKSESKEFKYLDLSSPAHVTVVLKGGTVLKRFGQVDCTGGMSLGSGMSFKELEEKFMDCTEGMLSTQKASEIFQKIHAIEQAPSIDEIIRALR